MHPNIIKRKPLTKINANYNSFHSRFASFQFVVHVPVELTLQGFIEHEVESPTLQSSSCSKRRAESKNERRNSSIFHALSGRKEEDTAVKQQCLQLSRLYVYMYPSENKDPLLKLTAYWACVVHSARTSLRIHPLRQSI